jgi:hypothetical protein
MCPDSRLFVQVDNFRIARHSGVTLTSYKPTNEMLCRLIPLPDRSSRSQTLIITAGVSASRGSRIDPSSLRPMTLPAIN